MSLDICVQYNAHIACVIDNAQAHFEIPGQCKRSYFYSSMEDFFSLAVFFYMEKMHQHQFLLLLSSS